MRRAYLLLIGIVFLTSCEKSITFVPDDAEPLVVVDASIENNRPPLVILSKSLNYFGKISVDILASSFIHNAEINISNGVLTHRLKEYSIPDTSGYTLYFYSIDSANLGTAFTGAFGGAYSLEIKVDGKTYTATTTIPLLEKIVDSVWWEKAPPAVDTQLVKFMARVIDPPGYGNYIRYFTKANSEPFYPGLNSVFDDQIVDGKTYSVQIDKGVDRNEEFDEETYVFFNRGDTATIKQTNIDKTTFDFWRTIESSYANIGNPFASPTKVLSNIKGGGLGYFGGYAAQFSTLIIPK